MFEISSLFGQVPDLRPRMTAMPKPYRDTIAMYNLEPIRMVRQKRIAGKVVEMVTIIPRARGTDTKTLKAMRNHDKNKARGYYKPNICKAKRDEWNKKNLAKWRKKAIAA